MLSVRRELRDVKRALREDIDRLDGWLKFVNIALVPLLIGAGGLAWQRCSAAAWRPFSDVHHASGYGSADMKPRPFAILALVAVLSVAVAVATYASNNQWSQARVSGAPLFPGLASQAARIAKIEIKQGDSTTTLVRDNERWVAASQGNYPAKPEAVRGLLVKLMKPSWLRPRPRREDRYSLLELEDPKAGGAKSHLVRLLDANGGTVAEVIVGKKRLDAFGSSKGGTYVRKPDQAQTWLANEKIDAPVTARDWVQTLVLNIDVAKVKAVSIEAPGQDALKIERQGGDKGQLALVGLPQDKKLKNASDLEAIVRAATTIDLDDVRRPVDAPAGEVSVVKITGTEGLALSLRLRKQGDDSYWLQVSASGEGDALKPAEDIRHRTEGWEYKIPAAKAQSILKRQADLLEAG